jgi:hypothetical protein
MFLVRLKMKVKIHYLFGKMKNTNPIEKIYRKNLEI